MDYFFYGAMYFVILHSHLAETALTLSGPKCGEKRCDINQYCSRLDSFCKPCSNICDTKSHNYEETECIKDCQGNYTLCMLTAAFSPYVNICN